MTLETPQIIKQGGKYGVKLRASAPSLHIMQIDLDTEVNSLVGTEQQSEELVKNMLGQFENDPTSIWDTKLFGTSLHHLVNEGLHTKLASIPQNAMEKMTRTMKRIVNEGKGGVICILL
jgi:stage IV sporulation protein A